MSRRDNAANRCPSCAMHLSLCLCAELPRLHLHTRLCLVVHRDEVRKTTNTGRLASQCIAGTERLVHGRRDQPVRPPADDRRALLLFPDDDAEPLAPHHAANVRLVVPDATWRQAAKMTRRIEWLASLPRVTLPAGPHTNYRLRSERRAGGLATLEAIARAMGVLEGPEVEDALLRALRLMVERTLFSRGALERGAVYGGVPDGVVMHDPRSGDEPTVLRSPSTTGS